MNIMYLTSLSRNKVKKKMKVPYVFEIVPNVLGILGSWLVSSPKSP